MGLQKIHMHHDLSAQLPLKCIAIVTAKNKKNNFVHSNEKFFIWFRFCHFVIAQSTASALHTSVYFLAQLKRV